MISFYSKEDPTDSCMACEFLFIIVIFSDYSINHLENEWKNDVFHSNIQLFRQRKQPTVKNFIHTHTYTQNDLLWAHQCHTGTKYWGRPLCEVLSSMRKASPSVSRRDEANKSIVSWVLFAVLVLQFQKEIWKRPRKKWQWYPWHKPAFVLGTDSMNLQPGSEARERALPRSVKYQIAWRRQIWIHSLSQWEKVEGTEGNLRAGRVNQDTPSHSMAAVELGAMGVLGCQKYVYVCVCVCVCSEKLVW